MRTYDNNIELPPPSLSEQREFWDWHWRNWRGRKTINSWKEQRHREILSLLRSLPLSHPRILDLGCGHGWFTAKLADLGEATGIDLSEEAIRLAEAENTHVRFIAGNLYEYPLDLEYYDVVVTQEVIDHVEDQVAFIDRAAHVLKSGGYFIVSCANKFVMDRLGANEFPKESPAHIEYYLSLAELKRLLLPRFKVIRARSILPVAGQRGILRLVHSYKVNTALRFLVPHEYLEALKERAGFGYQLIVLAQKR